MKNRFFLELDYLLLFSTICLITVGILFIYSSGVTSDGVHFSNEYIKQIVWASLGWVLAVLIAMFNYKRIYDFTVYFYLGTILLLVFTFFWGQLFDGSRWIRIGIISIQASEFAKITTILFLAWYLDSSRRNQNNLKRFLISGIITIFPMFLVLIQPDLGTALVFIPIFLGMTFFAGISPRYIIFFIISIILTGMFLILPLWQNIILQNTVPALMILVNTQFVLLCSCVLFLAAIISIFGLKRFKKQYFYWIFYISCIFIISLGASFAAQRFLREYQIMRLVIFLNPNVDPRGAGWHIIQSSTAIGSGGAFGKGFLQGTQSQYRFLPEQSTDFIFSILSEEWGFLGGILVFTLFLIICLRLTRTMKMTNDIFGSYIVAGLLSIYFFHFFVNVGMTMGIMPVTGIPLTFVSYGGSALVAAMIGIGLVLSVHVRKYEH